MIRAMASFGPYEPGSPNIRAELDAGPFFEHSFDAADQRAMDELNKMDFEQDIYAMVSLNPLGLSAKCVEWTIANHPKLVVGKINNKVVDLSQWVQVIGGNMHSIEVVVSIIDARRWWKSKRVSIMARTAVDHLLGDYEMGDEP